MKKAKVVQLSLTLCTPMDYTVHGILQARILEWVAFASSKGSSQNRDRTQVSPIAGGFFISWATREDILIKSVNFDCDYIESRLILSLPILEINQYWIFLSFLWKPLQYKLKKS